jgi:hypothetical protein
MVNMERPVFPRASITNRWTLRATPLGSKRGMDELDDTMSTVGLEAPEAVKSVAPMSTLPYENDEVPPRPRPWRSSSMLGVAAFHGRDTQKTDPGPLTLREMPPPLLPPPLLLAVGRSELGLEAAAS